MTSRPEPEATGTGSSSSPALVDLTRVLAIVVGGATFLYATWLLVIGVPIEIATIDGGTSTGRRHVFTALIPLLFSVQFIYGVSRGAMSMAWFGAAVVLIYGALSIFGMGIYIPLLGLGLMIALALHALALRAKSMRGQPEAEG